MPADFSPDPHRVAVTSIALGSTQAIPTLLAMVILGWRVGPLPLMLDRGRGDPMMAGWAGRATYLDEHVRHGVLGPRTRGDEIVLDGVAIPARAIDESGESAGWRAWRWVRPSTAPGAGVWAVEMIRLPDLHRPVVPGGRVGSAPARAWFALVLHASLTGSPDLAELMSKVREVSSIPNVAMYAPLRWTPEDSLGGSNPVFTMTMVTSANGKVPALTGATEHERHWLYSWASLTLPKAWTKGGLVPDFECDDEFLNAALPPASVIMPSADWRIAVLRNGAAFVGRRPDTGLTSTSNGWTRNEPARSNGDYFDSGELYMRTIFTDAIVLGIIQRHGLQMMRASALGTARHATSLARVRDLGESLEAFCEQYWWTDASRGGIADQLLRAYQDRHSLGEMLGQLEADVTSLSRRVHTTASRRTAGALAALSLLTVFSLSLSIASFVLSAHTVAHDPTDLGLRWLVVVAIVALFAMIVATLFLAVPDLRRSIGDAIDRRSHR